MNEIVTDSLGFCLRVNLSLADIPGRGRHTTHECEGKVTADALHKIEINRLLPPEELPEVAAHEAYHLFYSIRHLITVDEETEALVFGQLVNRIIKIN